MGCCASKVAPASQDTESRITSLSDSSSARLLPGAELLVALDSVVIQSLEDGSIRLVSVAYILGLKDGELLPRHQELLAIEGALLAPKDAAALLAAGDRRLFALSYGWLSAGMPDPFGKRLAAVQRALRSLKAQGALSSACGLFWDFASLPQKPRTPSEDEAFKRGLRVMANLYASAIGTCVLQLKEVPIRPRSEVGAVRVCRLRPGVSTAATLQQAYGRFGQIAGVEIRSDDEATLRFVEREAAIKALYFDPKALGMGDAAFACHEYNDRPYDDRGWVSCKDSKPWLSASTPG